MAAETTIPDLPFGAGPCPRCRLLVNEALVLECSCKRLKKWSAEIAMAEIPTTKIEVIQGPSGPCLSINDYRVCGPKPWGGGTAVASWTVQMSVCELLKEVPHVK